MKLKLLLVLFLMLLVALFSVQNAEVISVRFLNWHFEISEALVIILAAFFGSLVGLVAGAVAGRRRSDRPPAGSNPKTGPS